MNVSATRTSSINQDARAVFLPAFDNLEFKQVMEPFLRGGGCSVLIGETRAEYVARSMSHERLLTETPQSFRTCVQEMRVWRPELIVAVDQELGGIQRLQGLISPMPELAEATSLPDDILAKRCFQTAQEARKLGVTMFLAPIADVVDGANAWLNGRTIGEDVQATARVVATFVAAVQRAGIAAVTKHFPGFNHLDADPALADVSLHTPLDRILKNASPFRAAIEAGTKAIMTGPAPVVALDGNNAASTSAIVISLLREQFGFKGLIVSDDLDAPATLRGGSLLQTAISSLNAGADLLLVGGGPYLNDLCEGVAEAAMRGEVLPERLACAASRVRSIAKGC